MKRLRVWSSSIPAARRACRCRCRAWSANLRGKLAARGDIPSVHTDALLYCGLRSEPTDGRPSSRTHRRRHPPPISSARPSSACYRSREETPATAKILIQLDTDVSALMGHARDMVTRVSGGTAHWARRLDFEPFRLHASPARPVGQGPTRLGRVPHTGIRQAAALCLLQSPRWPITSTISHRVAVGLHLSPALRPARTCAMPARHRTSPCPTPSSVSRNAPPNCRLGPPSFSTP